MNIRQKGNDLLLFESYPFHWTLCCVIILVIRDNLYFYTRGGHIVPDRLRSGYNNVLGNLSKFHDMLKRDIEKSTLAGTKQAIFQVIEYTMFTKHFSWSWYVALISMNFAVAKGTVQRVIRLNPVRDLHVRFLFFCPNLQYADYCIFQIHFLSLKSTIYLYLILTTLSS